MSRSSGRVSHPNIICDMCKYEFDDPKEERYVCLDCADYDLCRGCENTRSLRQSHFNDTHVFAKIRDSTTVDVSLYRRVKK